MSKHRIGGKVLVVDDGDDFVIQRWRYYIVQPKPGAFYAARKVKMGQRRVTRYLHRELATAGETDRVRFRNGKTLDCRRGNLKIERVVMRWKK